MAKYYVHYTDNPTTVVSLLSFKQPSYSTVHVESMHYGGQPVFFYSEEIAIAVIALLRAINPDSPALSYTRVLDLAYGDG